MGNVRMRAEQINCGASNVKVALDNLDPMDLIALSARMDTIEAWKATVKAEEKTGASVEYTNALALPAQALSVELEPIQDLHGYDHPWAGGAGKNKLPLTLANLKSLNTGGIWSGNTYTLNNVSFDVQTDDGGNVTGIKGNGTANSTTTFVLIPTMDLSAFNSMLISGNTATVDIAIIRVEMLDNPWTGYSQAGGTDATIGTYAAETNGRTFIRVFSGKTLTNQMFYPMVRASGESATFAPYTNICPISGRTEARVNTENEDSSESAYATIQLGTTVYGGTVDFDTGVATVTGIKFQITASNGEFNATNNRYIVRLTDIDLPEAVNNFDGYNCISDKFVVITARQGSNNGEYGIYANSNIVAICGFKTSLSDYQTWLTDNPVDVCYELATPTTLQLTPAQLEMLKGYNIVTGDGVITITALTGDAWGGDS